MGKIIAICGKICCGKSYYANQIKEKENAVIFSTDEATYDLIDNVQGEFYDKFCIRLNEYLLKKAAELAITGSVIILDWGFWTVKSRQDVTEYCKSYNVQLEWHYIDINDDDWEKNIRARNQDITEGNGGSDFYVDDGLKQKLLNLWETPQRKEINVWHHFKNDVKN